MMDCKQVSRLLSQSLERPMSWRQRLGMRLHLVLCAACRQFERQLLLLRSALRKSVSLVENDERLRLSQHARQRIAEAVHAQGRSQAGGVQPDPNKTTR